jgi:hypothetical protein
MKKLNIVLAILLGVLVSNCSTYSIKPDQSKNGIVDKTPKWYVKYDRDTWTTYQEAASAVSPDMELAVKKSVLLAKAKLADRINGEMNNRTTITKNEGGTNESLSVQSGSQDAVVNMITETMIGNYIVTKSEIFSTGVKLQGICVDRDIQEERGEDQSGCAVQEGFCSTHRHETDRKNSELSIEERLI